MWSPEILTQINERAADLAERDLPERLAVVDEHGRTVQAEDKPDD